MMTSNLLLLLSVLPLQLERLVQGVVEDVYRSNPTERSEEGCSCSQLIKQGPMEKSHLPANGNTLTYEIRHERGPPRENAAGESRGSGVPPSGRGTPKTSKTRKFDFEFFRPTYCGYLDRNTFRRWTPGRHACRNFFVPLNPRFTGGEGPP